MRGAVVALSFLMGVAPALAQDNSTPERPMSTAEIRELLDAAKATAKATRDNVDYVRVMPDMMYQILTKLDKLEDKLDKIENAIKRSDNPAKGR